MTLAGRVSAFFLAWLGLSLAGFGAAAFFVVRADESRRLDDRLRAAADVLVAAAEVEADGVEWEPHERVVSLRHGPGHERPAWVVLDDRGRPVDGSGDDRAAWLAADPSAGERHAPDGAAWRVVRTRLESRGPAAADKHAALEIAAALPTAPVERRLLRLTVWLVGVGGAWWGLAAGFGRRACRRPLAPVADMAASARIVNPSRPDERLAVRPTGDELEALGRAFNGLLDRLHDSFERQRRFAGDAAHQLRTPVAAVRGQVEVALRRERSGDDYRRTLEVVAGEMRHLQRLTEALSVLGPRGRRRPAARDGGDRPGAALPELITRWRAESPRAADLTIAVPSAPAAVRAHPALLGQLLDNLLDNAANYSPAGTPIALTVASRDDGVEVAVADRGLGIAAEDAGRVFEPFFRTGPGRAANGRGTGLGLSVARRIAEAFGARIGVESEPGRGSRFAVRFPPAG